MFYFQQISKNRNFLFGLACIFICTHHLTVRVYEGVVAKAYMLIRSLCAVGVDVFFFLSAIGLYFSMEKNSNFINFYKRRIFRIFPTFLIISIPWYWYSDYYLHKDWLSWFGHFTSLAYWFNGSGDWFISAILFWYLIYPFFYKIFYKFSLSLSCLLVINCNYDGCL